MQRTVQMLMYKILLTATLIDTFKENELARVRQDLMLDMLMAMPLEIMLVLLLHKPLRMLLGEPKGMPLG